MTACDTRIVKHIWRIAFDIPSKVGICFTILCLSFCFYKKKKMHRLYFGAERIIFQLSIFNTIKRKRLFVWAREFYELPVGFQYFFLYLGYLPSRYYQYEQSCIDKSHKKVQTLLYNFEFHVNEFCMGWYLKVNAMGSMDNDLDMKVLDQYRSIQLSRSQI